MTNAAKVIIGDSRRMVELTSDSVELIITSPPYWHIKDYNISGQIGYGQTLHSYLKDLYYVWMECYRVLKKGCRFCLNIGDQFTRSAVYGRYKVIPLHAEFISQCEQIGFDYMGSVIWQKKTTMNTTGGATVMGSFPYPPNGIVEIDYEFIHIFKKPGDRGKVPLSVKEESKLTKEEWKEYFSGHWRFGGARQIGHEAMFPEELPKRLIKMFSFKGDTVLDPFLGSGTTLKIAIELSRNGIGYEINREFIKFMKEKVKNLQIIERKELIELPEINYTPGIRDAKPQISPNKFKPVKEELYRVVKIINEHTIELNTGLHVRFLGVKIDKKELTLQYLHDYILGKTVFLRFNNGVIPNSDKLDAYVYLKNKIFINAYLIKTGLGFPDISVDHKYRDKFLDLWKKHNNGTALSYNNLRQ